MTYRYTRRRDRLPIWSNRMALIMSQLLYLSVIVGIVISDVKSENITPEEFRNSSCRTELTCPELPTHMKIASFFILISVPLYVVLNYKKIITAAGTCLSKFPYHYQRRNHIEPVVNQANNEPPIINVEPRDGKNCDAEAI